MKAYIYKTIRNNKSYICSKFDNSVERVTIYHADSRIYQQYWQQGKVIYENKTGNIHDNVPPDAILSDYDIGTVIKHVWRPGLCLDIPKALEINDGEKLSAKRELKILIEKLHEILLYVEPDSLCLNVYGHKIRELLILACTECENAWTSYIKLSGNKSKRLTTKDYVKLKDALYLEDYNVKFLSHPIKIDFKPFKNWNIANPTTSLPWYDGYNKTKHDRENSFQYATLENCLNAICANIVMFCVRYSPYELIENNDICSSLINEYFSVELISPKLSSFYIPFLKSVQMASGAFSTPLASAFERNWIIKPFTI